jgi:hypothetical protein
VSSGVDVEELSDQELTATLKAGIDAIVAASGDRHQAWQQVVPLIREMERRYPPAAANEL